MASGIEVEAAAEAETKTKAPPAASTKKGRRGKKATQGKSAAAGAEEEEKKKRRKAYYRNLNLYIYKVLHQVHPELGMSKQAMNTVNSFALDCFERVATEAGRLVHYNKKTTLDSRAIEAALRLCFPGELGKHAVNNAQQSVGKYEATFAEKEK